MDQTNSKFYVFLVILMVIAIGMIYFIKPLTLFNKPFFSDETNYLKEGCLLDNKIKSFYMKNGFYPRSIKEVILTSKVNYDSLFSYTLLKDDYMLKFNFSIKESTIVFTKDSMLKFPGMENEK